MFWAGGDSLLVGPPSTGSDSVFQVKVTSIDGTVRDSIRVAGPGLGLAGLSVSPGGRWIVALVVQAGRGLWQVLDRSGNVADRVVNSCTCPGRITRDALWLTRSGVGVESIVRIGLDPSNGRLASRQDTLLSRQLQQLQRHRRRLDAGRSTTARQDYSLWALGLADALKGKFAESQRLVKTSTRVGAQLSPDGGRLLLARTLPTSAGGSERRFSILPFGGGSETPLNIPGRHAARLDRSGDGERVEPDRHRRPRQPAGRPDRRHEPFHRHPDSLVRSVVPLPDGWAWIPPRQDRVRRPARRQRPSTFPSRHGSASSIGLAPIRRASAWR